MAYLAWNKNPVTDFGIKAISFASSSGIVTVLILDFDFGDVISFLYNVFVTEIVQSVMSSGVKARSSPIRSPVKYSVFKAVVT